MDEKKLYHFLMTHETGISYSWRSGIEAWVHVEFCELAKFAKIISYNCLCEGNVRGTIQRDSVAVELDMILDDLEQYKDCFAPDDWEIAHKKVAEKWSTDTQGRR